MRGNTEGDLGLPGRVEALFTEDTAFELRPPMSRGHFRQREWCERLQETHPYRRKKKSMEQREWESDWRKKRDEPQRVWYFI